MNVLRTMSAVCVLKNYPTADIVCGQCPKKPVPRTLSAVCVNFFFKSQPLVDPTPVKLFVAKSLPGKHFPGTVPML